MDKQAGVTPHVEAAHLQTCTSQESHVVITFDSCCKTTRDSNRTERYTCTKLKTGTKDVHNSEVQCRMKQAQDSAEWEEWQGAIAM